MITENGKTPGRKRGRPRSVGLTGPQRRTLKIICQYIDEHGLSPTVSELAELLSISTASVHEQIRQLDNKGYVSRKARRARSLVVLREPEEAKRAMPTVAVPLVGDAPAGEPFLAEQYVSGEVHVDERIVRTGEHFALRVRGDSMLGAGIQDGDYVIVRRQALANNKDIVVALIGEHDATIKRLHISDEAIELRPENRKYWPIRIEPETEFRILGKVVGVQSDLN